MRTRWMLGLAAAACFASVLARSRPSAAADESEPRRGVRSEWFVLEEFGPEGKARTAGVARFSRTARPGSTQLETDFVFAREDRANGVVRVFAVEELTPDHAKLSWREVARGSGRSLRAEWRAGEDALDVTEWGNGPRWREALASDEGALLPHYLIELLRKGGLASGSVPCFDPLSRSIEPLSIATWYDEGGRARTVELARTDGTLFGRYRFEGERLVGFQGQAGGAWARAVDEAEHARAERELATTAPAGS
ncbi:MAG: hypothetical protein HZA53_02475 [Planctomycetes bacterium]|nr:hypothetical protein [Planctomycetota bacterium]